MRGGMVLCTSIAPFGLLTTILHTRYGGVPNSPRIVLSRLYKMTMPTWLPDIILCPGRAFLSAYNLHLSYSIDTQSLRYNYTSCLRTTTCPLYPAISLLPHSSHSAVKVWLTRNRCRPTPAHSSLSSNTQSEHLNLGGSIGSLHAANNASDEAAIIAGQLRGSSVLSNFETAWNNATRAPFK
jgi:hypothetical protein